MNNTLTGLGLALVLALLAALIGPWFIDWNAYRDDFAAQASVVVGAPVKVTDAVEARLLPTPYVRFRGLTSGAGAAQLSVDEVEIELAIAPLLRGEFRAERVRLVRPSVGFEITADGSLRNAFSGGPKVGKPTPAHVSFDRAEIVDGTLVATTPSGVYRLDKLSGVAEAGSLAGPYRFEGSAGDDKNRLDLRLSTGQIDPSGHARVKFWAARADRSLTIDVDGGLRAGQKPGFDGRIALARPPRRGEKTASDPAEPWSASAAVKLDAGGLRFGDLDLAYGADERAVRFGGSGAATLGASPRIDLKLESRQLDFDRLLGPNRPRAPAGVLAEIASRLPAAARPPANGSVVLDARGVVLAGEIVQDLKVELDAEAGRWRIRRASATFPGDAKAAASGEASIAGAEPSFAGSAEFDARDLPAFRRWVAGGEDSSVLVKRFALKGKVSAGRGFVTVENATLLTDGARSTGRVAWTAGGPGARARIEAALVSDRLDLDALGADRLLARALSSRTTDGFVAIDAKTLIAWGVTMRDVSLDGAFDVAGLDLRRLEIRDAGGARVAGAGRIAAGSEGPEGRLAFDVSATKLDSLVAFARAAGVPETVAAAVESRAAALAPVDLKIDLEAVADRQRMSFSGAAAGGRVDGAVSAADLSLDAPADLDLKIVTPDGARLAALGGFAISPIAAATGGEASLRLSGVPSSAMTGEGRFAALGVDLSGRGAVAVAVGGVSADGEASLKSDDLSALAALLGRGTPAGAPRLPVALAAQFSWVSGEARLEDITGEIAGRPVSGRLRAPSDPAKPIEAEFSLQELPLAVLFGLATSPEALAGAAGEWSAAAFGPSPVRGVLGRLEIAAARMPLGGGQVATDAAFTLALKRDAVAVEDLTAALDGGRISGGASISRAGDVAAANLNVAIERASVERLLGLDAKTSPLLGTADLKLDAQGSGRTVADLVGSMTGAGSVTLSDVVVRRLDPAAIGRIEPQVEAGASLDASKVAAALAREFGAADLRLPRVATPFTLSGGVARTGGLDAAADAVRLGGAAALDLRKMTLDAKLTLQPAGPDVPAIGLSFGGPLAAPVRAVDATSFAAFLSVRAVERETKRIEAMEADARIRARIARERQEEERKRAEAEKARLDAERRKSDAERKKRDAETRTLIDAMPRPAAPETFDLTPPTPTSGQPRSPAATPGGALAPPGQGGGQGRGVERGRPGSALPDALPAPQSILPPATAPR